MLKTAGVAVGTVFFLAVAALYSVTATAASSIIFLGVLWLLTPVPLVFLWRSLSHESSRLRRTLATSYLVVSTVLAGVVLGGVGWIGSERGIHPGQCSDLPQVRDYPQLQLQDVTFLSREGTKRAGWFVPGKDKATILLLHGYNCDKREMLPHADFLHAAGYSVFLFDFRNRGQSEGSAVSLGYYEQQDVLGAIDYLKTRSDVDADRLGALGVSMGGATAIMGAAQTPELKAVVSESAFRSADSSIKQAFTHFVSLPSFPYAPITVQIIRLRLGISPGDIVPENVVGKISPRPIFIIHGLNDKTISPDDGRALYAAAREPKELWLVPGSGHAQGVKVAKEEYTRRVVAFFDQYVRSTTPLP